MPYDEALASRIRVAFGSTLPVSERKMFGGVAFLVDGHMCVGVVGSTLMVRVGKDAYEDALARPHARIMDFTGRPLTGFVFVDPPGIRTSKSLEGWIARSLAFVRTLPAKKPRPRPPRSPSRRR